jgi:pyruvate,water dikinase
MKQILKGIIASKGKVEGEVFVVSSNDDLKLFKPGSILVTKITTPLFVPAMARSIGVITDIGGLTSHPAIISRELGIPCLVGAVNATQILKTGQKIILDALTGEVYADKD